MQVKKCRRQDLANHIGSAHVAVPMMSKLDGDMLRRGRQLKMVLQYGVGVEGIDIPTVSAISLSIAVLCACQHTAVMSLSVRPLQHILSMRGVAWKECHHLPANKS